MHFTLEKHFKFDTLICNKDVSYEPELFPALLIAKWAPVHVTLFPNGKGMITGIKRKEEAQQVLQELCAHLTSHVYYLRGQ